MSYFIILLYHNTHCIPWTRSVPDTGTGSEEEGEGKGSGGAVAGGVIAAFIVVMGIVVPLAIGLLWWRKR